MKKTKSKWAGEEVLAGVRSEGEMDAAVVVKAADLRNVRRDRDILGSFADRVG